MRIARLLLWMFLGYVAAVHVATLVTVSLVVAASALPDAGMLGSYYKVMANGLAMLYIGLLLTSIYAFPGWLVSVIIAAVRSIKTKTYFIIAGGLTALLAHVFFSTFRGGGFMFGLTGELGAIFLWSLIGGLCGGWAYWRVAVVRFGKWRVEA
jgi:hypothetical protein